MSSFATNLWDRTNIITIDYLQELMDDGEIHGQFHEPIIERYAGQGRRTCIGHCNLFLVPVLQFRRLRGRSVDTGLLLPFDVILDGCVFPVLTLASRE